MKYVDAAFGLLLVAYVVLQTMMGRFVQMDEVFFKAAGREWAVSGHFAAPEIDGLPSRDQQQFSTFEPPPGEVWFLQPPVYTFSFGIFTRLAGFGPRQCILFDALIHAGLALLTYILARQFCGALSPGLVFLCGAAVLPLGTTARPDELATCFGMAGLLLLLRQPAGVKRMVLSGSLFGLSAATTAGAAILLGMIAFWLLFLGPQPFLRKCCLGVAWSVAALVVVVLAIGPILLSHPDAYYQYLNHAGQHFGPGNQLDNYRLVWNDGRPYLAWAAGCLLVGLLSPWSRQAEQTWADWMRLWLGPLLGVGFLAFFLPNKYFYLWFLGPWMLVSAILSLSLLSGQWPGWAIRALTLVLIFAYALAAAPVLKNTLIMLTLPEEQALDHNAELVRRLIPAGSTVMTDDYWWVLGNDCRVKDIYFSRPPADSIDFIIQGGDGSDEPDRVRSYPPYLSDYVPGHFRVIDDNINREPVRVLGRPIPNTACGFGVRVLGRVKE